jgi:hypothetical protein
MQEEVKTLEHSFLVFYALVYPWKPFAVWLGVGLSWENFYAIGLMLRKKKKKIVEGPNRFF